MLAVAQCRSWDKEAKDDDFIPDIAFHAQISTIRHIRGTEYWENHSKTSLA